MDEQGTPRIVVAVDGTEGSQGALRYAVAQAASRGRALRIVHALPSYVPMTPMLPYVPDDVTATGETILRRAAAFAAEEAPQVPVTTQLLSEERVPGLVTAGDDSELLILGQESRHGLSRVLVGATTAVVAARTRCPCVVVPSTWEPGASSGLIVVGVKSGHDVDRLIEKAFDEAVTRGAGLRFVHTWELPSPYDDRIVERTHTSDWRKSGEEHLESLLAPWRKAHPEVAVEVRVLHAQPRDALVEESGDADLVIVLRHKSHLLPGYHLGGTARAAIALAQVPVEVVPPEPAPDEPTARRLEHSGDPSA